MCVSENFQDWLWAFLWVAGYENLINEIFSEWLKKISVTKENFRDWIMKISVTNKWKLQWLTNENFSDWPMKTSVTNEILSEWLMRISVTEQWKLRWLTNEIFSVWPMKISAIGQWKFRWLTNENFGDWLAMNDTKLFKCLTTDVNICVTNLLWTFLHLCDENIWLASYYCEIFSDRIIKKSCDRITMNIPATE